MPDKNIHLNSYDEDSSVHRDTSEELTFFHNVYSGNMEAIHKNCDEHRFMDSSGVGLLSTKPLTNIKYHMVVTAAIITRGCIEHGLEPERAFRMSDYYIRRLDNAGTVEKVEEIHNSMVLDFTGKMRLIKHKRGISRPVTKCLDYIYAHIYDRLTLKELSEHANVSASYLSRQFNKEIGIPLSDYIRERKIEISEELLRDTDESILDIACRLSFASQSHFIQSFKNVMGITPKKYRAQNSVKKWS
ncbi:MAG: helix-turn-helix transcriptional regulator [Eubacterium sp.]|nr:helix-turn-helix transcriptional regulator [Eubacterium sp.]MBR1675206.1 helix-turn-helix transcriptional regulator [Eubacterium sp.]